MRNVLWDFAKTEGGVLGFQARDSIYETVTGVYESSWYQ